MIKKDSPGRGGNLENWLASIKRRFSKIPQDRDAITEILRAAEGNNLIEPDTLAMIEGAMGVSELRVRDIMIPRVRITSVQQGFRLHKIIKIVTESGYSRFPVFGEAKEEVIGIMMAKDLLNFFGGEPKHEKDFDIKEVMRPAIFVPESKRLNVLLREFRENKNHMVIVVDEYSYVAGLVTIEDILEEIIGDIFDEHDYEDAENIRRHGDNRYTLNALTTIEEFNTFFESKLKDDGCDTIGGLVMHTLGRLPKRGEKIENCGFLFTVLRTDRRKINLLHAEKIEPKKEKTPLD